MSKLLLTGGAGYIGSHTVRALMDAGHDLVVLDNLSAGREQAVGSATLVVGDVGDQEFVRSVFSAYGPFDGVLHFAGYIEVARSMVEPLDFYDTNLAKAITLLGVSVEHGTKAFVFSSTAAVYGIPESQPIAEDAAIDPINPYGSSKSMFEQVMADAEQAHGIGWIALRYFNACGAHPDGDLGENHEPETHLIPLAIAAAAGVGQRLQLRGTDYPTPDGTCVRDYVHVTDLASAHVAAVEGLIGGAPSGAFNLGTGVGQSNRQVLEAVGRVVAPVPYDEADRRPGDPAELVADSRAFRDAFDWEPKSSDLDTIVASAWKWHQSQWGVSAPVEL